MSPIKDKQLNGQEKEGINNNKKLIGIMYIYIRLHPNSCQKIRAMLVNNQICVRIFRNMSELRAHIFRDCFELHT